MARFGERAFGRRTAVTGAGAIGALATVLGPRSGLAADGEEHVPGPHHPHIDADVVHQRPASDVLDRRDLQPAGEEILRLFGDLKPGARFARWNLVAIYGVHLGAIAVVLQDEGGAQFQVDVLRRDLTASAPAGIGSSAHLTVFLANAGDGSTRTHEDHGIAALALVQVLAQNEGSPLPAALRTMRQRLDSTPTGSFSVIG